MTFNQKIKEAEQLIKEQTDKYPKRCVAISFGKDSMVLNDLVQRVSPTTIIAVLANTEFAETLELRDKIKEIYSDYKEYNFKNDPAHPEDCCRSKKVEKFKEALKSFDMWLSGIRKDEGNTRNKIKEVEKKGNIVKVNPILHFTEKDIWRYTALYDLPVNPRYKEYRSLSCRFCSSKEEDENESERAGRWKGQKCQGGECGIHTKILK